MAVSEVSGKTQGLEGFFALRAFEVKEAILTAEIEYESLQNNRRRGL